MEVSLYLYLEAATRSAYSSCSMQNLGEHPALLVKCQRNWFPAYLTGFKPVTTRAGKEAKQRDMWEIQAHPATAWAGVKALSKENIMYLDDDRLAECVVSYHLLA